MDKSYVTLETKVCPVCGKEFETGNLLLDEYLRNTFERHTATGYTLCEEHQKLVDDGYIFIIACSNAPKTEDAVFNNLEDAKRTGLYCALKKTAAQEMFSCGEKLQIINFCEPEVINCLKPFCTEET